MEITNSQIINSPFEYWALQIAKAIESGEINPVDEDVEDYLLPVLIKMGNKHYCEVLANVIKRNLTEEEIQEIGYNKKRREEEREKEKCYRGPMILTVRDMKAFVFNNPN